MCVDRTEAQAFVLTRQQEDRPIPDTDKAALRNGLIPAMIALSNVSHKAMRAQVAEAVSIIAAVDFPDKWPDLVDVSTFKLGRGSLRVLSAYSKPPLTPVA